MCTYLRREKAVVPVIPVVIDERLLDYPNSQKVYAFRVGPDAGPQFWASSAQGMTLNQLLAVAEWREADESFD